MNKILIALVLVVGLSGNVFSKTLETNIDGVVIKDIDCSYYCRGTIVNRKNINLGNISVNIKLFDKDNDPIGSCNSLIRLGANSGTGFLADNCNGRNAKKISINVEANKY
tara:strand:- start:59 stop:388 length:330 start_codon:yes stop_codon:yes gene_type:complete